MLVGLALVWVVALLLVAVGARRVARAPGILPRPTVEPVDPDPAAAPLEDLGFRRAGTFRFTSAEPPAPAIVATILIAPDQLTEAVVTTAAGPRLRCLLRSHGADGRIVATYSFAERGEYPPMPAASVRQSRVASLDELVREHERHVRESGLAPVPLEPGGATERECQLVERIIAHRAGLGLYRRGADGHHRPTARLVARGVLWILLPCGTDRSWRDGAATVLALAVLGALAALGLGASAHPVIGACVLLPLLAACATLASESILGAPLFVVTVAAVALHATHVTTGLPWPFVLGAWIVAGGARAGREERREARLAGAPREKTGAKVPVLPIVIFACVFAAIVKLDELTPPRAPAPSVAPISSGARVHVTLEGAPLPIQADVAVVVSEASVSVTLVGRGMAALDLHVRVPQPLPLVAPFAIRDEELAQQVVELDEPLTVLELVVESLERDGEDVAGRVVARARDARGQERTLEVSFRAPARR